MTYDLTKVKIFKNGTTEELEREVNNWLAGIYFPIKDIKYSCSHTPGINIEGEGRVACYTVMVIYVIKG